MVRVCVIGAGPSGMSAVKHFAVLDPAVRPEVVCFEKQETWGGLWNYNWRTGTDQYGELCHNGMYKNLWINTPKEMLEYPDYTWDDHFNRSTPSFTPRNVIKDYLEGRWMKYGLKRFVRFNNSVKFVKYEQDKDIFRVDVTDLAKGKTYEETFSHVIVANGVYSTPSKPDIPGIETFPGTVIHVHDFRDPAQLKGKSVLAIGSGLSGVDVVMLSKKYQAAKATLCYRSRGLLVELPEDISVHYMVEKIDGDMVYFKDGASDKFDTIIMCTGYLVHFPFLEEELKLKSEGIFYPKNLYKGVVFLGGGNNKLFYIGLLRPLISFQVFNLQGLWICRYIQRAVDGEPKSEEEMRADENRMLSLVSQISNIKHGVGFLLDYAYELAESLNYNKEVKNLSSMAETLLRSIEKDIAHARDQPYASIYTGTMAAPAEIPWFENFQVYL